MRAAIIAILTVVGAGIAVGFVGGIIQPFYLLGALSIFFMSLIADIISMINYLSAKASVESAYTIDPFATIAIIIYAIMAIVYFFAIIDWWRGEM